MVMGLGVEVEAAAKLKVKVFVTHQGLKLKKTLIALPLKCKTQKLNQLQMET